MSTTAGPITITVDMAELGLLSERMQRAVGGALNRARKRIETDLLAVVPFKTGELFESMKVWQSGDEGLKITFDAPYARIVEMGASPHEIRAKGKSPLTFWWPRGPQGPGWYHYRSVQHPGYSGRGFLWRVKQIVLDAVLFELGVALKALELQGRL